MTHFVKKIFEFIKVRTPVIPNKNMRLKLKYGKRLIFIFNPEHRLVLFRKDGIQSIQ